MRLFRSGPRWLSALAAVALMAFCGRAATAQTLTLTDTVGDPSSTTVAPGGSFVVNTTLDTQGRPFTGLSYYLQSVESTASRMFSITGRSTDGGNPLEDPQAANPFGPLSPRNAFDLGYGANNVNVNKSAGTYPISTLTLSIASSLPAGTYTIRTAIDAGIFGGTLSDASFDEFGIAPSSYAVTVAVPEPGGMAAGAAVVAAFAAARRRRSNAGWQGIGVPV